MFHASQRRVASSGANRWLLLAGLGLLVLGLVLRMMLDIGAVGGGAAVDSTTVITAAGDSAAVGTTAAGEAAVDSAALDTTAAASAAPPTTDSSAAAPPTAAPPTAASYVVQLGLFSRQSNAESIQGKAAALGYTATVHPLQRGTRTLYRVSVDGIPTSDAAKQAADSLSRGLKINGVVVTRHGD